MNQIEDYVLEITMIHMRNFFENGGALKLAIATFRNVPEEDIRAFYKEFREKNPKYSFEDNIYLHKYISGFRLGIKDIFDKFQELYSDLLKNEDFEDFEEHVKKMIPNLIDSLLKEGYYGIHVWKIISEEYDIPLEEVKEICRNI